MTSDPAERWMRVKQLFAAALEKTSAERALFLTQACGEDPALRNELETLLAAHDQAGSFLDSAPAFRKDENGPPALDAAPTNRLVSGARLGPYEIVDLLGEGGMGQVYRARDTRLGREVAIKVLAAGKRGQEALRRFEQEARATCALNHANIVDVHDIGTHEGSPYIVSELLHGTTLRERLRKGPLSVQEASGYALQLAQGLSAAHDRGVVHRDLKPENLFITHEGRLKILDFGIAKLVTPMTLGTGEKLPSPLRTEEGAILGTVGYMSPEQVRGQPADQRSDVFSFGAIVYEMLAGRGAFERDTAVETGSAILKDDRPPLPAGVPPELDRIVHRCVAKRPEDRFESAHELVDALVSGGIERAPARSRGAYRWVLRGGAALTLVVLAVLGWRLRPRGDGPGGSIAVLPFVNMSSDRENEYFSDGITEELISALANVEGIRVSSRTSAFAFKGKDVGIRKIAEELHVSTVLEGSVRREGQRVRVTAQLVSAADGYHLWSSTYDRELKNIFALEDELARSIARALAPRFGTRESKPLVREATASSAAHDAYLRGRYVWNRRTKEGLLKAISFFQQAIAEDPSYALAYAGLADSYALLIGYDPAPHGSRYRSMLLAAEQLPRAKEAARRALELDGTLAEAHAALGLISTYEVDWGDSSAAEREYRRAIELKPEYATAHQWYAMLLVDTGRPAEARIEIDRARQLDPTSPIINTASALLHNWAYEYPQAIDDANKALELDPHFASARVNLAVAYMQTRRYDEALAELEAVGRSDLSQRDAARSVLAELGDRAGEYVSPVAVASVHVALGDKDAAFVWLDKAYAERDVRLSTLKVAPLWDPLRSEPRFARLLKRLHLE